MSLAISAAGFIPGAGALVTTAANWVALSDVFAVSILEPVRAQEVVLRIGRPVGQLRIQRWYLCYNCSHVAQAISVTLELLNTLSLNHSPRVLQWFAAKGMADADARAYVAAHRWVLLGFCAPFALLSAVPFAGGVAAAVGHAAAAYLVYYTLEPPAEPARRATAQAELAGEVGALKRGAAQPVAAAKAAGAKLAGAGSAAAEAVLRREGPAAAALRAVAPNYVHDVK
jgi:hypothetical protein